jgi:hypothetical protein
MHTVRKLRRRVRDALRARAHRCALALVKLAADFENATSRHPRPRRLVSTDLWNG